MFDEKVIGKRYPKRTYEVGIEKIREFARAIRDENPLYHDEEFARMSVYGRVIAPPTFCTIFAIKPFMEACLDPDLGIDLVKLVHAEQEFHFHNVIKTGDRIVTDGWIEDVRSRRGLHWLVVRSESIRETERTKVVTGLWTALIRD